MKRAEHCTLKQRKEKCGLHDHSLLLHQRLPPAIKPQNNNHFEEGNCAVTNFDISNSTVPAHCIQRVAFVLHNEALYVNSCYRNTTKQTRLSGPRWLHGLTAWTTERWQIPCSHWQDALGTYCQAKRLLSKQSVTNLFVTQEVPFSESFSPGYENILECPSTTGWNYSLLYHELLEQEQHNLLSWLQQGFLTG